MKLPAMMVPVVLFLLAADAKEDAAKAEFKKLEGTWKVISGEVEGMAIPGDVIKDGRFAFRDGKLTVKMGAGVRKDYTLKLDPSTDPKSMKASYTAFIKSKEGKREVAGFDQIIYQLDKDVLKLCVAHGGANRKADKPKEFKTEVGKDIILFVLKREKK